MNKYILCLFVVGMSQIIKAQEYEYHIRFKGDLPNDKYISLINCSDSIIFAKDNTLYTTNGDTIIKIIHINKKHVTIKLGNDIANFNFKNDYKLNPFYIPITCSYRYLDSTSVLWVNKPNRRGFIMAYGYQLIDSNHSISKRANELDTLRIEFTINFDRKQKFNYINGGMRFMCGEYYTELAYNFYVSDIKKRIYMYRRKNVIISNKSLNKRL